MGPREEDNDMLLLVVVLLISVTLVGVWEIGQTRPAVAARPTSNPTILASDQPVIANDRPVRVILPFAPNTTPRER